MRLHQLLDVRGLRLPVEAAHNLLLLHEHECGDVPDPEPLRGLGIVVHVHPGDLQPPAFLACEVREQALHPPGRARASCREEDEQRLDCVSPAAPSSRSRHPKQVLPDAATAKRGAVGFEPGTTLLQVTELYTVGVFTGFGVAVGVLLAGLLAGARIGAAAAIGLAAAIGAAVGLVLADVEEAVGGGLGGLAGAAGAGVLVGGALRHGGARVATGALLGVAAVVIAALAFVPALGYLMALALPALGVRVRRRGSRRFAGLRTLARD
jgi:hypothetical protein